MGPAALLIAAALTAGRPIDARSALSLAVRTALEMRANALTADRSEVPPSYVAKLPVFKHALRDYALAIARQGGAAQAMTERLEDGLRRASVWAAPPSVEYNPDAPDDVGDYDYTHVDSAAFEEVPDHPELLALEIGIAFPCGIDSSLYLLDRENLAVRMEIESDDYTSVSAANGDFTYAVSPPDAAGSWFVVTATVAPWPSSNWSMVRAEVRRPGAAVNVPVVAAVERSDNRDIEPGLVASSDGFTLTYWTDDPFDGGSRDTAEETFRLTSHELVRLPPATGTARDVFDDWVRSDWSDAHKWTRSEQTTELRRIHDTLREPRNEYYDRLEPDPCRMTNGRWSIWLTAQHTGQQDLQFVLAPGNGSFVVEAHHSGQATECERHEEE